MTAKQVRAGQANVELGVRDRLAAGLKMAERRLQNFAQGAIRIGGAATAAGGAMMGALLAPVSLAAGLEQTSAAFETMLGSAGRAAKLMKDLQAFAASTPFEFTELADASKKLLAFGSSAENIPAELQRIGDISSAVGAPLGEIAELYGKARVQGTLYAEDINQLVGRGIPVIQEFAKQLGVSEGQVKKMASEGQINFAMLDQAFIDLTSSGGKFAGMMAKQSETTIGKFSTLKDTIAAMLRPIGEALLPVVNSVMQSASNLMSYLTPVIEQFKALAAPIAIAAAVITGIGAALLGTALASAALSAAIATLTPIFATVFGAIGAVIAAVMSPIGLTVAALVGIGVAAQNLFGVFDPVFKYLADGFTWLKQTFLAAWGGITDAIAAGDLGLAAQIGFAGFKLAVSTAMESVLGIFGGSIASMSSMLAELWKQIGSVVARLNEARASVSQWIAERMGDVVGVEVLAEDNADLMNARAWSQSFKELDTSKLAGEISGALSPETYQKELEALMAKAKEARAAAEAAAAPELEGPAIQTAQAAAGGALNSAQQFAAVGSFAAANIAKQLPGAKSKDDKLIANTGNMVTELKGLRSDLSNAPGLTFG